METDRLTDIMGSVPILSVKRSINIDRMINFDGDGDGHGDGDGTCKKTLKDFFRFIGIVPLEHGNGSTVGLVNSCVYFDALLAVFLYILKFNIGTELQRQQHGCSIQFLSIDTKLTTLSISA